MLVLYEEVDRLNSLIVFRKYMKRYASKDRFLRLGINRGYRRHVEFGLVENLFKKSTDLTGKILRF